MCMKRDKHAGITWLQYVAKPILKIEDDSKKKKWMILENWLIDFYFRYGLQNKSVKGIKVKSEIYELDKL